MRNLKELKSVRLALMSERKAYKIGKILIANDGRTFKLEDYEMLLPEVM